MGEGSFQLCGKLFGDCILISYMAKDLFKVMERFRSESYSTRWGSRDRHYYCHTWQASHSPADSAVAIVRKSGH